MPKEYRGFTAVIGGNETVYDKHKDPDHKDPLTVVAKNSAYIIAVNQAGEEFQLREKEVARYRHG